MNGSVSIHILDIQGLYLFKDGEFLTLVRTGSKKIFFRTSKVPDKICPLITLQPDLSYMPINNGLPAGETLISAWLVGT